MPKILGVDDSATMRLILEMTFAGDGASITTIDRGDAAIRAAGELGADIVLADASMEQPDGYEIARQLKANPATQHVPVIVMASQHHPFDAERARQSGVDDHVLKPFDTQAVLDKVREAIKRRAAAGVQSAARPMAGPPTQIGPAPMPSQASASRGPVPIPFAARAPQEPARAPARTNIGFGAPALRGASPSMPPAGAAAVPGSPGPAPSFAAKGIQPAPPVVPTGAAPNRVTLPSGGPAPRRPTLELADEENGLSARPPEPLAPPPPLASSSRAAVATANAQDELAAKLTDMGLTQDQVRGVLALSREVIERVVWEVVPDLAETIIREEIRRLTSE